MQPMFADATAKWVETPIKERQAHAVLENGPFLISALFKMVRMLWGKTPCVQLRVGPRICMAAREFCRTGGAGEEFQQKEQRLFLRAAFPGGRRWL